MPQLTLFGSRDAPWRTDAWRAVDDRIRGGKSKSHFVAVQRMDGSTFANFYGNLDIKTLGGAGFASQSHTSPYDLSKFNGLSITIQPSARRDCSIFHLNIKTELPRKRKDGRNESVIVWEYEFDVSETMMMMMSPSSEEEEKPPLDDNFLSLNADNEKEVVSEKEMEEGTVNTAARTKTFKANWDDFIPTYRGRPVPKDEAKALNPGEIKEISIMCRSNFGKQSGDFNLFISDITAFTSEKKEESKESTVSMLSRGWNWLKEWFLYIFGLRRTGRGFIRL